MVFPLDVGLVSLILGCYQALFVSPSDTDQTLFLDSTQKKRYNDFLKTASNRGSVLETKEAVALARANKRPLIVEA